MFNIAVIGAGVVGLSTALNIQKVLPAAKVRIIADKYFKDTTSYGAGGLFLPRMREIYGVPSEHLKKWYEDSWNFYSTLALSPNASETGHVVVTGYFLFNRYEENHLYKDIVFSCREVTGDEMKKLKIANFKFKENGGELEHRRIQHIEELAGQYDVVVNCAGLGNRTLMNDSKVYPIRGQVIRVKAPWIKQWYYTDDGRYLLINKDTIVLGGTKQVGNENEDIDPHDTKKIIDGCLQVVPALTGYKLDHAWIGLRPARTPLRLEKEIITCQNGILKVVHNYGHGYSGVSLSWGTSLEAAGLVKELLTNAKL